MPDRMTFSEVGTEGLESFTVGGGLEWLLEQLDFEYERETLAACTNEKPAEDEPATTYFVTRYAVDDVGEEVLECTCPAYRYQQVPKPEQVKRGVISLDMIGRCKHLEEHAKRSRSLEDRDEGQSGLEDVLDGDGGGFGG